MKLGEWINNCLKYSLTIRYLRVSKDTLHFLLQFLNKCKTSKTVSTPKIDFKFIEAVRLD